MSIPGHRATVADVLACALAETAGSQARRAPAIEPRYGVRIEKNVRIPTRDGTHLAADLIRPDAAGAFPIVVEYIPYRKDDVTRGSDDVHYYLAERGIIGVRLDVRGTGGSDGVNTDEYMPVEQQDGFDAIEWLAKQPYSNGRVGMFGTSYGGFTCIQVAMHRPPHLKAIVPLYATDDRYTDDCHYSPGGNMRMYYDVGTYGGNMVAMNALPPSAEGAGTNWAELWKSRLEKNEPYLLKWMHHQVDDDYWRAASLRPGYDRIECPVFLIAGWHDGYVNTMLRTFTHLKVPKKILIGPWVHARPNVSVPGPRIDYLDELARFFAHHLRDEDTGIMREPAVTFYMQESPPPIRTLDAIPGRWRAARSFPVEGTHELTLHLAAGGELAARPGAGASAGYDEYVYRPAAGTQNRFWSAGGMSFYLAGDQREDEASAVTFTSAPLERATEIFGWPRVVVHASSSASVATFVAKLADVAPDGSSTLIADGSLNGTRRSSLREPTAMQPDKVYELDIPMMPTGWVVQPGHRLRLALSSSDFPNLWPTPEPARNRIYRGGEYSSRLVLPVLPAASLPAPSFMPPPQLRALVRSYGEPPTQQVLRDQISGTVTVINRRAGTTVLADNLGSLTSESQFRCTASELDPAQASIVGTHRFGFRREEGVYEVVGESTIRATRTTFHIVINLHVTRNGRTFFQKSWMASEPRRLL
jgi:putative CocE/NonD family hydrolase